MARIRTIKPEFPQSESMGRISRDARLLFVQMWTIADDSGRLRGNSRMLASLLFPYDDDAPALISGWLEELHREACVICYKGPDGGSYVEICNWKSHQKIDKPSESKIPPPDSENIREDSRGFEKSIEASLPSRARADQGPRTKDQDQGPLEPERKTRETSPPEEDSGASPPNPHTPSFQEILNTWNATFASKAEATEKRRKAFKARSQDKAWVRNWREAIAKIRASPFCNGTNDRNWVASIDWFLRPDTVQKAIEGTYNTSKEAKSETRKPRFV